MQTGPNNPPELPASKPSPKSSTLVRLDAASDWWNRAWEQGGVLHGVWEDIRRAPKADWHGLAHWIKALALVVAAGVVVMLLSAASSVLGAIAEVITGTVPHPQMDLGHDTGGIWPTLTTPIRTFLVGQAAYLPALSGATVYTLWQATGLIGLIGGFLHITGARILWALWGTGSTGGPGRTSVQPGVPPRAPPARHAARAHHARRRHPADGDPPPQPLPPGRSAWPSPTPGVCQGWTGRPATHPTPPRPSTTSSSAMRSTARHRQVEENPWRTAKKAAPAAALARGITYVCGSRP
ncbi:hypothetical protein [Streptomyces zaomyceticus]|uniref:hypothetical protein n=1 Tax=Streptomyces zaomyceticus TaxID=68286 RepID=UPI0033BBBFBF